MKIEALLDRFLPKEIIGDGYLHRWILVPPNRFFTAYIHKFVGDDFLIPHDHPAASLSIKLKGDLMEEYSTDVSHEGFEGGPVPLEFRLVPKVCFRTATHTHRLSLIDNQPCWTLFMFGPRTNLWGFYCPKGWVPWQKISDSKGNRINLCD